MTAKIFFYVSCFSSLYMEHFRAYTLQALHCDATVAIHDLVLCSPVHIRTVSAIPHQKSIILFTSSHYYLIQHFNFHLPRDAVVVIVVGESWWIVHHSFSVQFC